jgi:hypothetical protein
VTTFTPRKISQLHDVDSAGRADDTVPTWSAADGEHVYLPRGSSGSSWDGSTFTVAGDINCATLFFSNGIQGASNFSVDSNGDTIVRSLNTIVGSTFGGSITGTVATFSNRVLRGVITLAIATGAIDAALGNTVKLSTAADFTIANPTNGVEGQTLTLKAKNTAGTDKTLTWGTGYSTGAAGATVTLKAGKTHLIPLYYDADLTKWIVAAPADATGYS